MTRRTLAADRASTALTFLALAGAAGAVIYCLIVLGANQTIGPVIAYEANPLIRLGELGLLFLALPVVFILMVGVARHK
jgi:hypothetical protein